MKKIWFSGLIFLSIVLLAGCQEEPMGTIEVDVIDLSGTVLFEETISYDLATEESLFAWLDQTIDLDYTVFDFGTMIHGIEGFYPMEYGVTFNYWFSIYVNDEFSTVGIEQIELSDGIHISFRETTLLDETDLWVDQVVYGFIEAHLDTYITQDAASHHVIAALKQLIDRGYDVLALSDDEFDYPAINTDIIAELFKSSVTAYGFGLPTDTLATALTSSSATNHYDSVSLLNTYHILRVEVDQVIIDDLVASLPMYMDADYAGMVMNALAPYASETDVDQFMNDMFIYIDEHLTLNGVESWGNPNASATASVIMGLVANGINPRSSDYTTGSTDLIEALSLYEMEGTFKYLLSDEQADLAFSTPQVFAALVAYKLYRDVWGNPAVNLFVPYL